MRTGRARWIMRGAEHQYIVFARTSAFERDSSTDVLSARRTSGQKRSDIGHRSSRTDPRQRRSVKNLVFDLLDLGHAISGFVLFEICATVVFGLGATTTSMNPMSTHLRAFYSGTDAVRVYHTAPEGEVRVGLRHGCVTSSLAAFVAVDGHRVDSRVPLDGEELACCDPVVRGSAFRLVKDLVQLVWVHEAKPFSCFVIHHALAPQTDCLRQLTIFRFPCGWKRPQQVWNFYFLYSEMRRSSPSW